MGAEAPAGQIAYLAALAHERFTPSELIEQAAEAVGLYADLDVVRRAELGTSPNLHGRSRHDRNLVVAPRTAAVAASIEAETGTVSPEGGSRCRAPGRSNVAGTTYSRFSRANVGGLEAPRKGLESTSLRPHVAQGVFWPILRSPKRENPLDKRVSVHSGGRIRACDLRVMRFLGGVDQAGFWLAQAV